MESKGVDRSGTSVPARAYAATIAPRRSSGGRTTARWKTREASSRCAAGASASLVCICGQRAPGWGRSGGDDSWPLCASVALPRSIASSAEVTSARSLVVSPWVESHRRADFTRSPGGWESLR